MFDFLQNTLGRRVLIIATLGIGAFIVLALIRIGPLLSQQQASHIVAEDANFTLLPTHSITNSFDLAHLQSPRKDILPTPTNTPTAGLDLPIMPPEFTPAPPPTLMPLESEEPAGFAVTFSDLAMDTDLIINLGLPTPSPGGRPWGSDATEWGIQINGCDEPLQPALDLVVEHGFTWIKQQVRWGDIEYINDKGKRAVRWTCLDQVISEAKYRGLRVLLSVTTAPVHLRPPSQRSNVLGPPADIQHFIQFLSAILTRYENRIDAIEVWNEPNLDAEWREGVNPLRYSFLLKAAALTIRMHDPNIIIISGGLAPIDYSDRPRYVNDLEFWASMHENGSALWIDCIGYHANGPPPNGFMDGVIERYQAAIEKQDPILRRPLCLTEVSFSLPIAGQTPADFGWAINHTEEEQAQRFQKWIALGRSSRSLRLAIVFNLNYLEDGRVTPNSIAALLRPDLRGLTLAVFRENFGKR